MDAISSPKRMNRRALLLGSAAVAGLTGLARPSRALTIEEVYPNSPVGLALKERCGGPSEHVALIAQLEAELAAASGGAGEASRTAVCPICGCPVTVTKPPR